MYALLSKEFIIVKIYKQIIGVWQNMMKIYGNYVCVRDNLSQQSATREMYIDIPKDVYLFESLSLQSIYGKCTRMDGKSPLFGLVTGLFFAIFHRFSSYFAIHQ